MRGFLSALERCLWRINRWLECSKLNQRLKHTSFSLSISKGFFPNFMIALGMVCFWTSVSHFIEVFAEHGFFNTEAPASAHEALSYFVVLVLGFIFLWLPKRSWISLGDFESDLPVER